MTSISLSDLAAFCLSNAERARSFAERVVWLTLARSIVTQDTRAQKSRDIAMAAITAIGPYLGWTIQQRAVRPTVDPASIN